RRLVEKRPVGLEQGEVSLLPFDLPLQVRPFGRDVLGRILERIDPDEGGDAGTNQNDVQRADHAAPLSSGTPSPRRSVDRGALAVRRPLRRIADRARGLRSASAALGLRALDAIHREASTATCGRWRDRAGPALAGSKKRLTMRSSSE